MTSPKVLNAGIGCGIGCISLFAFMVILCVIASFIKWYESAGVLAKTGGVIGVFLILVLIAIGIVAIFYFSDQKKKRKLAKEIEYLRVLEEYRQTLVDNSEIKNHVVVLGKELLQIYPEKYSVNLLLRHLHEVACLHREAEYQRTLALLQNNSGNQILRNRVRDLGKWLADNYSSKYSEQSLTNDLMVCLSGRGGGGENSSVAAEIQKLGILLSKGFISQEEFERGKAMFLGSPPDKAKKTLEALGSLYRLMKQGALSESEYNVKKWDLLSGKLIK